MGIYFYYHQGNTQEFKIPYYFRVLTPNWTLHLNLQEKIENNYSNGHKYDFMLQADSNKSLPYSEAVLQEKKL